LFLKIAGKYVYGFMLAANGKPGLAPEGGVAWVVLAAAIF